MPKKPPRPGPRGLSLDDIAAAAVELLEEEGADAFSVRKVAGRVGCDPMAVLYHFKSKLGLERAMADRLNARLTPVDRSKPWRARLEHLAQQYREIALRHPNTFPLLLRFWVTGPADYRHAEMVYQALSDAGLPDRDVVDFCFGLYAGVLGLAAAESGGLLKPADADGLAEVRALPVAEFPQTHRLLPQFIAHTRGEVYRRMVAILLDGIEQAAKSARRSSRSR